jgi:hypothetical protein
LETNMYSFGDSTTFPLQENFLDTLMATVRTSAALFAYECKLHAAGAEARDARVAADLELAKLVGFQNAIVATLSCAEGPASVQAAQLLREAAARVLAQTREEVTAKCNRIVVSAKPKNVSGEMHKILSAFWLTNQLPKTRWSFYWRPDAEGEMRADLRATAKSVTADFRTEISAEEIWGAPISVSSLMPSIEISVPVWKRRAKGTECALELLDGYEIYEVDSSPSRQRLVLRRINKPKYSVMITLADAAQSGPTIVLIDGEQDNLGDVHVLSSSDTEKISKLWNLLLGQRSVLIASRSALGEVSFANRNVNTIADPSRVAEAMLAMVAPLTREIRLRSRMPGELILQRNLGKGRREEIFMSRDSLQAHYANLPDKYRRVFDAMGLGNESTCDFVTLLGHELADKPIGRPQRAASARNKPIGAMTSRSQPTIAQRGPVAADTLETQLDSVLLDIEAA